MFLSAVKVRLSESNPGPVVSSSFSSSSSIFSLIQIAGFMPSHGNHYLTPPASVLCPGNIIGRKTPVLLHSSQRSEINANGVASSSPALPRLAAPETKQRRAKADIGFIVLPHPGLLPKEKEKRFQRL